MTFEQIEQQTGINWWTVKNLFYQKGINTISLKDRAKIKRRKDMPVIYELYFKQKLSYKEIYAKFGFSPAYSRQVLKEFLCSQLISILKSKI